MLFETSEAAQAAGITYHLIPATTWTKATAGESYEPESLESEGFIHCTDGTAQLLWVGNTFYREAPGEFRVLVIETARVTSSIRYDDPDRSFPHIYGPLNLSAVIGILRVRRGADGTFEAIELID